MEPVKPQRIIRGDELPPQAWSSRTGTRLRREVFLAPTRAEPLPTRIQPAHGGLYTSSMVFHAAELLGTVWSLTNPIHDEGQVLYQVMPKPRAKVLVIDSFADLTAAIARWPHHEEDPPGWHRSYPAATVDWPAAARDVDAIWLTKDGAGDTRRPGHPINLYTWDTEQVLWLTPAFVIGRRLRPATPARVAEVEADRRAAARVDYQEAFRRVLAKPGEGPELLESLREMDPAKREVFSNLLGFDLTPDADGNLVGLVSLP